MFKKLMTWISNHINDTKRMNKFESGVMITREDKMVLYKGWKHRWIGRDGLSDKVYQAHTARELLDKMIEGETNSKK